MVSTTAQTTMAPVEATHGLRRWLKLARHVPLPALLILVPLIGVEGAIVGWALGLVCQAIVSLAFVALYLRRWADKAANRLVFDAATAGTRRRSD